MSGPVDVLASIDRQRAAKEAARFFPRAVRKQRKSITQADVDAAVNETLDSLDREFRRLELDFPKHAQAYDTARVVVKNARRKA